MITTRDRCRVKLAKRALARHKGNRHVAKGDKVCWDTRWRLGLYDPDTVSLYTEIKQPTQVGRLLFDRVTGLAEDAPSKTFAHTINMPDVGKQYNVHLADN